MRRVFWDVICEGGWWEPYAAVRFDTPEEARDYVDRTQGAMPFDVPMRAIPVVIE